MSAYDTSSVSTSMATSRSRPEYNKFNDHLTESTPSGAFVNSSRGRRVRRSPDSLEVFQKKETLPPTSKERSRSPRRTLKSCRRRKMASVTPSPVRTERARARSMNLRLRVEGVKGLAPTEGATKDPPSTYVVVQTSTGRGRTPVIRNNANPPFRDEFVFAIRNPEAEEVTVMLLSHTAAGSKKLGHCVISPGALVRGKEKKRWVYLVRHPSTEQAYEYATVLISMYTEDFGIRHEPSEAKENEFRRKLRTLLKKSAPRELHRLEWYVGTCAGDYDEALAQLIKKYRKPNVSSAAFQIVIHSVSNLTDGNGSPSACEMCCVKVAAGSSKKSTGMALYRSSATFDETFSLSLDDPVAGGITLSVCSAEYKFGECIVSIRGIQKSVPRERTCHIVYAAGTGDATYSGTITFTLFSSTYGRDVPIDEDEEELRRTRVQNYLWNYLRDDLHRLDPILYSIDDMDDFMGVWTRTYGSEPRTHLMRLRIRTFRLTTKLKHPDDFMVVVRAGPNQYATSRSRYSQEFKFGDELVVHICEPSTTEVLLLVVSVSGLHSVEVGRAAICFADIPLDTAFSRDVVIYENALNIDSREVGTLLIEGVANSFGLSSQVLTAERRDYYRQRVAAILSRNKPTELYRVEYLLSTNLEREEELIVELTDKYGPERGNEQINIQILGIKEFLLPCTCYVKVNVDGVQVLKTKTHRVDHSRLFDISSRNSATVHVQNPLQTSVRFELAESRILQSSRRLGIVELSLVNVLCSETSVYWLPIYSPERNEGIGLLGVQLDSPGFSKVKGLLGAPREKDQRLLCDVLRDVETLFSKFCPENLPHVQPIVAKAPSLKDIHHDLRNKLTAKKVLFTFYVQIDSVNLMKNEDKRAFEEGQLSVEVYCMHEHVTKSMKAGLEGRIMSGRLFPDIRLDILQPVSAEPQMSIPSVEIIFHKKRHNTYRPPIAVTRQHAAALMKPLNVQTEEVGRTILSLRALLTEEVYSMGEPFTVSIVPRDGSHPQGQMTCGGIESTHMANMGEVTLRVEIPAFEAIPRCLQFGRHVVHYFQRDYVRYYAMRIANFFKVYDPWKLCEFHYVLYERNVATGKWPRSLQQWLVSCIKTYGKEPAGDYGPEPKLLYRLGERGSQGAKQRSRSQHVDPGTDRANKSSSTVFTHTINSDRIGGMDS